MRLCCGRPAQATVWRPPRQDLPESQSPRIPLLFTDSIKIYWCLGELRHYLPNIPLWSAGDDSHPVLARGPYYGPDVASFPTNGRRKRCNNPNGTGATYTDCLNDWRREDIRSEEGQFAVGEPRVESPCRRGGALIPLRRDGD